MKRLIHLSLCVWITCSFMTPEQRAEWAAHFRTEIEAISDDPSFEEVDSLVRLASLEPQSEGAEEIKELARKRLYEIPDFPDRLWQPAAEARAKWLAERGNPYEYNSKRRVLAALGRVPHPRSISILGEALAESEWPGGMFESLEGGGSPPNCILAAKALGRIIENPPLQKSWEEYWFDDVPTWELWYAQVKAGTRTFRLKGDPQEYSLTGPVSEARKPTVGGIVNGEGPAPPATNAGEPPPEENRDFPWIAVAAASGLLALALWRAFGRRKTVA